MGGLEEGDRDPEFGVEWANQDESRIMATPAAHTPI